MIGFVDWYSGWPEAFPVPHKSPETVASLLMEEIISKHSTPVQIGTDNGTENVNQVMRHTIEALKISHVTTPQGNSKVE